MASGSTAWMTGSASAMTSSGVRKLVFGEARAIRSDTVHAWASSRWGLPISWVPSHGTQVSRDRPQVTDEVGWDVLVAVLVRQDRDQFLQELFTRFAVRGVCPRRVERLGPVVGDQFRLGLGGRCSGRSKTLVARGFTSSLVSWVLFTVDDCPA